MGRPPLDGGGLAAPRTGGSRPRRWPRRPCVEAQPAARLLRCAARLVVVEALLLPCAVAVCDPEMVTSDFCPSVARQDCTAAARQLGLGNDLTAATQAAYDRPVGCWYQDSTDPAMRLWFNDGDKTLPPTECSETLVCLCCRGAGTTTATTTAPPSTAITSVAATTAATPPGDCIPQLLETGSPYDSFNNCLRQYQTAKECTAAAGLIPDARGAGSAFTHNAEDRPDGCWFQVKDGTLYFNVRPAGSVSQNCTSGQRCICCAATTTSTTSSTTSTWSTTSGTTTGTTSTSTSATSTGTTTRTTSTSTGTATSSSSTSSTTTTSTTTTTMPPWLPPFAEDNPKGGATIGAVAEALLIIAFEAVFALLVGIHCVRRRLAREEVVATVDVVPAEVAVLARERSTPGVVVPEGAGVGLEPESPRDSPPEDADGEVRKERRSPLADILPDPATSYSSSPNGTGRRAFLIEAVFADLDATGSGFLRCSEMQRFALFMGYTGTEAAWRREFLQICAYLNCDPVLGVDLDAFGRMVNDSSSEGCFCTNADLQLLRELVRPAPRRSPPSSLRGHSPRDSPTELSPAGIHMTFRL